MSRIVMVVPCFDEAKRLPVRQFEAYLEGAGGVEFLFVDDGSRDGTWELLRGLEERWPERVRALRLGRNQGKAEAVRAGMLAALESRPQFAGYWDADLATPLEEIPRLRRALEDEPSRQAAFGSRVRLLGRIIERRAARHYLGRVYATAVSLALDLPIYDSQCGAKLFRVTEETEGLFREPFCVGWSFDVEIVARWIRRGREASLPTAETAICEVPLRCWRDVPGSKVSPRDFVTGLLEVYRIHRRYRLRRAAG